MQIDIRELGADRHGELSAPILTAFGLSPMPERAEAAKRLPELTLRLAAFDGDLLVGSAASFSFTMTTPGASVATAGLTMVAVLPTHRRRGILTALMRRHLDEARAEGRPVAALWASESSIYGRFGYGFAARCCSASIERDRSAFLPAPDRPWRARLLGQAEALDALPPLWDRLRGSTPGMLSRSRVWWEVRRLHDWEQGRPGTGPLQRVVLELDGRAEAYALYRLDNMLGPSMDLPAGVLQVIEAVGATPAATRAVWRYLLDMDLIARVNASFLPLDHPLSWLLADPRRIELSVTDSVWVRLVDVDAALGARSYGGEGRVTLEVEDRFCPWNAGRYLLEGGERVAVRTDAEPDLRLDVAELGSAYLGGVSFRSLADAGRVEERTPGGVERADCLFRSARAPWCPEMF